jgi:hypothetical protein
MDQDQDRAVKIIGEITSLHQRVVRTIDALKNQLAQANEHVNESNLYTSIYYWRLLAFSDGMIKIRLMIEENFKLINTFGVLATTRYVLELLIWYRLLTEDLQTYGGYYVCLLISEKLQHEKAHLEKVKSEIELFKELQTHEDEEGERALAVRRGSKLPKSHAVSQSLQMIGDEIDRLARRKFSLYREGAKTRGFGYQALLMERQAIPQLEQEVDRLEKLQTKVKLQMPNSWLKKKWSWSEAAKKAGMSQQHDFVYGYTSRLLHAKPMSITTHQKNLEGNEIVMFLDFVYVSILDAIEISEKLVGLTSPSYH